jgi:hypothetical protein
MRTDEPMSAPRRAGRRPVVPDEGPAPADESAPHRVDAGSPGPTEVVGTSEQFAAQLRDSAAAVFMSSSLSPVLQGVDPAAYRLYRDKLIAACGAQDPIEVMIIEQLALAHWNTGVLHAKASNSGSVETAGVYLAAAARLLGEFRRSSLGLQAFRAAARQLSQQTGPAVTIDVAGMIDEGPGKDHGDIEEGLSPGDDDAEPPDIIPFPRAASL